MLLQAKPYIDKKIIELKYRVNKLGRSVCLAIIRVGDDEASKKYVNNKIRMCEEVGIISKVICLKENVNENVVLDVITKLNNDSEVDAILLQLPLPKHLDENKLIEQILPEKDVDGFTSTNLGKLFLNGGCNIPCTPKGIIDLLKFYDIPLEGKDVLIINRSNIVGKPLAHLLLKENTTVTIAHSKTEFLQDKVYDYDIIITAVGTPNFFDRYSFSPFSTIIDVSINFDDNNKICGDLDKSSYSFLVDTIKCDITPVPGGVGPMTVISLIEQTIEIAEKNMMNNY